MANSITLNGSSQYALIDSFAAMDALTDFTFEGWFRQDASGGVGYAKGFQLGTNGGGWFAQLQTDNGTPSTGVNFGVTYSGTNADGYAGSGVFDTNTWVHIVIVGEQGQPTKIYKNGVEIGYNLQNTPTGTIQDPTGMDLYLFISRDLNTHFKGQVSVFRLWNTVRTQQQIQDNLHYKLQAAQETGLIVNCNFNEGSGTVLANDGVGGNATLFGNPTWNTNVADLLIVDKKYTTASAKVFEDLFTEASYTLLTNHTPDLGASWSQLWQSNAAAFFVVDGGDFARPDDTLSSQGMMFLADETPSSADYEVTVEVDAGFSGLNRGFILARVQDQENMYALRFTTGASVTRLYKKVAGTWSAMGSFKAGPSVGDLVTLRVQGNQISYRYGDDVIDVQYDSDITTAGKAGLGAGGGSEMPASGDGVNSSSRFDNFLVSLLQDPAVVGGQMVGGFRPRGFLA